MQPSVRVAISSPASASASRWSTCALKTSLIVISSPLDIPCQAIRCPAGVLASTVEALSHWNRRRQQEGRLLRIGGGKRSHHLREVLCGLEQHSFATWALGSELAKGVDHEGERH